MNEKEGDKSADTVVLKTVEDFLAHALALESEVAEKYEEIADSMSVHNNRMVAELLHKLARASQKHAAEMRIRTEGRTLPAIAPWDFQWGDGNAPETPSMDDAHYLMTPRHALQLARDAEIQAQNYYTSVADSSPNPAVRDLALEFAYEEAEHVDLVNRLIERYPDTDEGWDFDPDPPGIPE
ncbi:MAG: ferritin family protein [Rhodospirillales bacterium]|nr:ferritin family protein [Rhodospirillales bacterium]